MEWGNPVRMSHGLFLLASSLSCWFHFKITLCFTFRSLEHSSKRCVLAYPTDTAMYVGLVVWLFYPCFYGCSSWADASIFWPRNSGSSCCVSDKIFIKNLLQGINTDMLPKNPWISPIFYHTSKISDLFCYATRFSYCCLVLLELSHWSNKTPLSIIFNDLLFWWINCPLFLQAKWYSHCASHLLSFPQ